MVVKASINGPNRRRNRAGDKTVASDFDVVDDSSSTPLDNNPVEKSEVASIDTSSINTIHFKIKSLDSFLETEEGKKLSCTIGNSCVFSVRGGDDSMGRRLLSKHFSIVDGSSSPTSTSTTKTLSSSDPLLIHFHSLPIFTLRTVPIFPNETNAEEEADILYLSQVHCHNNKICEDSIYEVTCCSRPLGNHQTSKNNDYDLLSAVGIEVFFRYTNSTSTTEDDQIPAEFSADDIAEKLMNQSLFSVLNVNECLVVTLGGAQLVCRVSRVCVVRNSDDVAFANSSAEVCLDEPYHGRVTVNSEFYIEASHPDAINIIGGRTLPEGDLPEDAIHITTCDGEWFPVRRILLAPCIKLTKYIQANRGKYKEEDVSLPESERSPDAPKTGIHCKVDIDCCSFDRVLLFLMSQMYPDEYKFSLDLSETNVMSHAADILGLQSLSDLCHSQVSSFASRVRTNEYIRFSEVKKRNESNELLIIVDGMVLDITRWIDEHPGGPSIIPAQALNIDCTCFFEMYHVSRQSFLYLKSFYIGELLPADVSQLHGNSLEASEGFLVSLRSYTDQWRAEIIESADTKIHKSL